MADYRLPTTLRPDQAARRKRWSEKSAVTKRAQKQKVSLAPVPSLSGGDTGTSYGNVTAPDVSARLEVPRDEG
jgi:hypothetical protein